MGNARRFASIGLMGWMSVVLSLTFMIGCSSKDDPVLPAPVEITDISYMKEMNGNVPANEGDTITIEGVATMGTGVMVSGRYLKFHIQDATGGAYVFADTQAQAALKEATAREAEAQMRYSRINDMYQRKVVAKATLDEASAARDAAAARLIAARAGLEAAREGVSYTEIRAPYAGVVTQKHVQVGEAVAPGTPLMTGASLDALRVVVEVPQSMIDQVRTVRKAAVYVDGRRIESTAVTLFPAAQPETSTFRARIELPKDVKGLAPGMFVKVGLVTGEAERLMVPASAIVERSEMRGVYVVAPDGRVTLRQVRLGHARGNTVEILAGLVAGERIALEPVAAGLIARRPARKDD